MKKKTILFISTFLILFLFSSSVFADNETFQTEEWEYTENKTGWTLTKHLVTAANPVIPDEIEGTAVTQLGKELFMNDTVIESAVIPDSVTAIGANAFFGCTSLKEVYISSSVKAIPDGCFRYCIALESVDMPYTLTSIGANAFSDCMSLTSVDIPANVMTVGTSAFAYCQKLEHVSASRKLITVNADAFLDTPWIDAQSDDFVYIGGGVLLKYNGKESHVAVPYGTASISNAFDGNFYLETVDLPETLQRINQFAFRNAVKLKTVTIPDSVTTIGPGAFQGCKKLEFINLPDSVTSVGDSAFRYCDKLSSLTIPETVKSIPNRFAGDCSSLVHVKIPKSVTTIHVSAFAGSENVQMMIPAGAPAESILQEYEIPCTYFDAVYDSFYYSLDPETKEAEVLSYTGVSYNIEIPAWIGDYPVTSVADNAFKGNSTVRSITIPFPVKNIGDNAFSGMENLETIMLPAGLETIGSNVFTGSDFLIEVLFPESVAHVGDDPFDADTLTKICAYPGSESEKFLTEAGFIVNSPSACGTEAGTGLEKWAYLGLNFGDCDLSVCGNASNAVSIGAQQMTIQIVRIPDGTISVTLEMVSDAGENIFLYVPDSVGAIDPLILENRSVTVVGNRNSFAERFAKDNDVKFSVRLKTGLNYDAQ